MSVTETPVTLWALATVKVFEEVALAWSEVVDTATVSVVDVVVGFVTPSSSTVTLSPALTLSPLKMMQVSVVPEVLLQSPPTSGWPLVVLSVTMPAFVSLLKPVPEGNVSVIVLPAAPDMPPVEEVVKRGLCRRSARSSRWSVACW